MRKVLFLLSQLTDEDVELLMELGERVNVPAGTTLIQQGRSLDSLYILLDGTLELSFAQVKDQTLHLGCGEVVGEISLLDSRPPTATVKAATDCILLALPHSRLIPELQRDGAFASRFYRSLAIFLAHRLRNTYSRLGYGADESMDEEQEYEDELSPELLDNVHLAGTRFDRVLRKLLAE